MGTHPRLKSLSLQLMSLSAGCTESLSLEWTWRYSTSPRQQHRDRELALCDHLPDPSGLGHVVWRTPSCPSGSRFGFRTGEAALSWSCVSATGAALCCGDALCQVALCAQTPLSTQAPLGLLTSLKCFGFGVLFPPELRHKEVKLCLVYPCCSLCYLFLLIQDFTFQACQCSKILKC